MASDYALIGPPTIDLVTFQGVLTAAGSPAAGQAPAMYAAIRTYGVDPAVVLAIMQHESNFGKAGIAVGRNNGFGSRYYGGTMRFGAIDRGGWAGFPTWAAGAGYTASLLASARYAGTRGANTARTFATVYAPTSDGNNPTAYGLSVVNAINRWTGQSAIYASKGTPVAAPVVAPVATPAHVPRLTTVPVTVTTVTVPNVSTRSSGETLGILALLGILLLILLVG